MSKLSRAFSRHPQPWIHTESFASFGLPGLPLVLKTSKSGIISDTFNFSEVRFHLEDPSIRSRLSLFQGPFHSKVLPHLKASTPNQRLSTSAYQNLRLPLRNTILLTFKSLYTKASNYTWLQISWHVISTNQHQQLRSI